MRINRRFLYAGLFLLAIGAVLVLADLNVVDATALTDALRLWPLAVIAIGLGIVLRRTQFSLQAGTVAAVLPGLVLGGAFAVGPRVMGECGERAEPATTAAQQGTFGGPATVSLSGHCGAMTVRTAPGAGWQLRTGAAAGRVPVVRSSTTSLSIEDGEDHAPFRGTSRNTWDVTLPTTDLATLELAVFAGQSQVSLPGARIGRLALTANAAHMTVDASEAASLGSVDGAVRVGSLSLLLPNGNTTGSLRIGAGRLRVCAPASLGLRVSTSGSPRITVAGERERRLAWQSPNYASAVHRADLRVDTNFGSVEINPTGGCK